MKPSLFQLQFFAASYPELLVQLGSSHTIIHSKSDQVSNEIAYADLEESFNWLTHSQTEALLGHVRINQVNMFIFVCIMCCYTS